MELDGKPLISEYDPEAGSVTYRPTVDLPSGGHNLLVRLRDRAGNEAQVESRFRIE